MNILTDQTTDLVAAAATLSDAIDLGEFVLLGVMHTPNVTWALLRSPRGEIARVETGNTVFGYTIAAIGDGQVQLTDSAGKLYALSLPGS